MKYAILDKNHNLVFTDDLLEWGRWFETADRIVQQDTLPNGKFVSTVFLGLNHAFGGKPLWFETMVFPKKGDGNELDLDMERYETWNEAERGHREMVEKYK